MSKEQTGGSQFDALLEEITGHGEDLTKAVATADDTKIEAAAAEGAAAGEGDKDPDKDGDKDCAGEGEVMGKSLTATDPETGEQVDAIDATDLLKSIVDKIGSVETGTMTVMKAMVAQVKAQGDLIKSLHNEVRALGGGGRGRKSLLHLHDKGVAADLAKSLTSEGPTEGDGGKESEGMAPQEFLSKALDAAKAGAITYHDANFCETVIGRGGQPPAEIIRAVAEFARKAA